MKLTRYYTKDSYIHSMEEFTELLSNFMEITNNRFRFTMDNTTMLLYDLDSNIIAISTKPRQWEKFIIQLKQLRTDIIDVSLIKYRHQKDKPLKLKEKYAYKRLYKTFGDYTNSFI